MNVEDAGAPSIGSSPANAAEAAELGFEAALSQLEKLAHELESGQLGLADSLARYERGVSLLRRCQELLRQAERRVELLVSVDARGAARTRPLPEGAGETLEEKAENRAQRRGAPKRAKPKPGTTELFDEPF